MTLLDIVSSRESPMLVTRVCGPAKLNEAESGARWSDKPLYTRPVNA